MQIRKTAHCLILPFCNFSRQGLYRNKSRLWEGTESSKYPFLCLRSRIYFFWSRIWDGTKTTKSTVLGLDNYLYQSRYQDWDKTGLSPQLFYGYPQWTPNGPTIDFILPPKDLCLILTHKFLLENCRSPPQCTLFVP